VPEPEVLEHGALAELRDAGGDDAFVDALIAEFAGEAPGLLEALHAAVAAGDAPAAASAAHTLRSSAAIFGAARLGAACRAFEEPARQGRLEPARVGAIEAALAEAQAALAATSGGRP
jgi:two-component system, sensor histidine kinase and response regulator